MFLYRDDYYNPETEAKNIAEVIIAKHRAGPTEQRTSMDAKLYKIC